MKDLTKGRIIWQILLFSMPMLLGNVFQQLYNVVDSIIVGNFIGKQALASVGASFPVIFVLTSFFMGISIGISVLISHFFGAKDKDNVRRCVDVMLGFNGIAGVFATIVGMVFTRQIFNLLNTPADIIESAVLYFRIYSSGMLFFFAYNGISSVLRGLGDSKTPLYFLIVSTLLNIILDYSFVVFLGWGIAGVAIATVIAQFVTFCAMLIYLQKTHPVMRIRLRSFNFDMEIFRKSIKIGLPTGIQQTFVSLGMMALLRIVNDFGSDVVAGYTVASRLDSFAMMPAMNFSMALSTFVGQNLGAGKIDRVSKGLHATLFMSALISLTVTAIFWLFGDSLLTIFTQDKFVIATGFSYLKIVGSCYILFSSMFVIHGFLRGAGDTLIPMIFTIFSLWILRIPASFILSRDFLDFGTNGIWFGIPIAWLFGTIASYIYFRKARWKENKLRNHLKGEEGEVSMKT